MIFFQMPSPNKLQVCIFLLLLSAKPPEPPLATLLHMYNLYIYIGVEHKEGYLQGYKYFIIPLILS